jgi:hypothetical protein
MQQLPMQLLPPAHLHRPMAQRHLQCLQADVEANTTCLSGRQTSVNEVPPLMLVLAFISQLRKQAGRWLLAWLRQVRQATVGCWHGFSKLAVGCWDGLSKLAVGCWHGLSKLAAGCWHGFEHALLLVPTCQACMLMVVMALAHADLGLTM